MLQRMLSLVRLCHYELSQYFSLVFVDQFEIIAAYFIPAHDMGSWTSLPQKDVLRVVQCLPSRALQITGVCRRCMVHLPIPQDCIWRPPCMDYFLS